MRTQTVQADGLTITIRGRTRRTAVLSTEYLVALKQAHPDMKAADPAAGKTTEGLTASDPRAWSLLGVASTFRILLARCSAVAKQDGESMVEPFTPDALVKLFNHYLDCEVTPNKEKVPKDQWDVWSQVEAAIAAMDDPPEPTDPNVASDAPKK